MRRSAFWLKAAWVIAIKTPKRSPTPSQASGGREIHSILRPRNEFTRSLLQHGEGNVKLMLQFGRIVTRLGHSDGLHAFGLLSLFAGLNLLQVRFKAHRAASRKQIGYK